MSLAKMEKDRRQFPRWPTSIPCSAKWRAHRISGEIANISLSGALIIQMVHAADRDTEVLLSIKADSETIQLACSVSSRVVRSSFKSEDPKEDRAAWMAVTFDEPLSKLRSKTGPSSEST